MAETALFVEEPAGEYWEFALSQDGTFATIGPWQESRTFLSQPSGEPFVYGEEYTFFVRDQNDENIPERGWQYRGVVPFQGAAPRELQDLQMTAVEGNITTLDLKARQFLSAVVDVKEDFEYGAGFRTMPDGRFELIRYPRSVQNGVKPIAPILEDRTVVVGVPFTFMWDEFLHATSYVVSGLLPGFEVLNPANRSITGTASAVNSGQEVIITAYGPTGLTTSASFTMRATAPEARNIQTIYQQPNGSGGTRLYLFGDGGSGGIKIKVLSGTTVLVDDLWTKDPGKWDAPGVFDGYAPYTYLIPALPNGNYTVEAQLGSSSQALSAPMVVNGTTGARIYPFSFNAYLNRPALITGGVTHPNINDGDLEAEFSITLAPEKSAAIQGIVVQNTFPYYLKVESFRFFPATSSPQARQSLAGAYLISAKEGLDHNQTLTQNLNTPNSKNVRLPDPIPDAHAGGDYFDIPWDGQDAAYFILQSENNYLAGKEIEVKGYYEPNPPPKQVKAIEPITVMEGSSGYMGLAQFFSDPGDILTYGGILNGNIALPSWLNVVPYTGRLTWTNVPFEGLLTENQTYYPANVVVVDTGFNQLLAPIPFYVKRINTLPDEVELLIFHLDAGNMSGTTYLRATEGTWASNLIGVDVDYTKTAHGTATGSYTANGGIPFNRLGVPYLELTAGKTYIHELYKPGSNPLVIFRSPVSISDTSKDYELGKKNTGSEEVISSVFVDGVLADEEHKILARSRATGPVTLRIVKVGGGYDSGLLTPTIPAGKDYYEALPTGVVADGTYEVVAALVSNPNRKTSTTCLIKTEVKRMTIYPTNVTNGVMYGIAIAARTSPKTLPLQFLKPAITGESWSVEVETKVDFTEVGSSQIRAKITGISGVEPQWKILQYDPVTNTEKPGWNEWSGFNGLFGHFPEMPAGYTHGDMAWLNQGEGTWARYYFRIPGYVPETLLYTQDHNPNAAGHDWTQRMNLINSTTETPAEATTMGNNPGQYTGTDDTHRYTYGAAPPFNVYTFDESHIYPFRIGTSGPWTNTKPYARNGDGVGIRRNIWPISGGEQPGTTSELLDTATVSWILDETYSN